MTERQKDLIADALKMVAPFLVGLVIGVMGDMLQSQRHFVLKEDWKTYKADVNDRLRQIDGKLQQILLRLPRETAYDYPSQPPNR